MWSSNSDGVGQPELVGHQDRVCHLVELRPERVGRDLAVDQAVPRERAVGQLLALEQEERRVASRGEVAGRDEAGPGLVEVAREDLAIGPEVGVVRVAGRHGLTPRRGEAGHDGARERLVLRGLDHVGAQVVGVLQLLPLGDADRQLLDVRIRQRRVVGVPAGLVGIEGSVEAGRQRPCRRVDRLVVGRAEAEGQQGLAAAVERQPRRRDDVALAGVGMDRRQRVGVVELLEAVALRAGEPDGSLVERAVERGEDRLGVIPVGGVGRGDRVGGHEDRMAARVIDGCRVRPAIARATAAVAVDRRVEADEQLETVAVWLGLGREREPHQDGVPARVGHVGGLDAVQAVLVRRGHLAGHPAGVGHGLHRVRHVTGLEVGEGRAVRDDVLERLDVGVVDGRVVDVAEDPAGDRVPDLRLGVPSGAQAVLAGQVEVRQGARAAGRAMIGGDLDREDVRRRVVGEGDLRAVGRDVEGDVRPVRDAVGAVVLVKALVDRDLGLVRAGRQRGRLERVDAVAVDVLQPGPEAARIPVARRSPARTGSCPGPRRWSSRGCR